MKLILIHGRSQENFIETEIKKEWTSSLDIGLQKSGLVLPSDITIEFPYYGKLLKKLVDEARSSSVQQGEAKRSTSWPIINETDEIEFFEALLGEISESVEMTKKERVELEAIQKKTRGPLNWQAVQYLLSFLDNKQIFGDMSIKRFTLDVFMYLTTNSIKRQINETVVKVFDKQPCVVVGHSLGSIISYLVLKNNSQFNVKKLITIGSPLGLKTVRKYLEPPLRMPECIINGWFNAYDERDYVALNPLDKIYFNIMPPIENKRDVNNHTRNRHGIVGYLDDAVIAKEIYEALVV